MKEIPTVILKTKKADAVERFHPWVFSGAVKKTTGIPADGDMVHVYSNKMKYLATGHYQEGSIAVRLFSWEKTGAGESYWKEKLEKALAFRRGLFPAEGHVNAFRLIFAEGDGFPGMIIDVFNDILVFQSHSVGMHLLKPLFTKMLRELMGAQIKAVYDKSGPTMQRMSDQPVENHFLYGENGQTVITEHGCKYQVDVESGQKTGFFLDQRDNRKLLAGYAKDKTVLNMHAYTGGFSVSALKGGAKHVDSVDSSLKAVELINKNMEMNGLTESSHQAIQADDIYYLNNMEKGMYDLIVLDPPAFAKSRSARHNAVQGYKRLNAAAMEKIKPGGLLFTFSCSMVVDRRLFEDTITAAAIKSRRKIAVIHTLGQPADHPASIYHPEGNYLKGMVLKVE